MQYACIYNILHSHQNELLIAQEIVQRPQALNVQICTDA